MGLDWRQAVSGEWHTDVPPKNGMIHCIVRCPSELPIPPKKYIHAKPGEWEIIMGDCFWSRDKERYFRNGDEAKEAAEKLLRKLGGWLREELGAG